MPEQDDVVVGGPVPKPKAQPASTRRRDRREVTWLASVIPGHHVSYDEWPLTGGGTYCNFIMKCNSHTPCKKTRGAHFTKKLGELEPLAFLHAWLQVDWNPCCLGTHAQLNPSPEAVAAVLSDHEFALQELYQQLKS